MYLSHCYRACNIVTRQRETLTVHIDTGSSPVTNTYYIYIIGSIGAVGSARVLCARGPGFEPLMEHIIHAGRGGLAQLEERVVSNDEAPGSKPGFSIVIIIYVIYTCARAHQWCSGIAYPLPKRMTGVRILVGAL